MDDLEHGHPIKLGSAYDASVRVFQCQRPRKQESRHQ